MNLRIKILFSLIIVLYIGVITRLFYWQIIKGSELSSQAQSQYLRSEQTIAPRGEIYASDGTWLAAGGEGYLIYANPQMITEDSRKISEKLTDIIYKDQEIPRRQLLEEIDRIVTLLNKKNLQWVKINPLVDKRVKDEVEGENIKGLGFEYQNIRMYPEASASAHLLGFVGKDEEGNNKGYFGLEGYYDIMLSGKPGYLSRESDAQGIPILFGKSSEITAIQGVDLYTSVDKAIQLTLDKKLYDGMVKYGAKSANAVIMETKTGRILAMSAYPSYDPKNYQQYSNSYFINPVISLSFEPGSIFKVIIMASALDSGEIEPDTVCDSCRGPLQIGKYSIGTWDGVYYPDSKMTDVIVHSDNVGMVFVGRKLGSENLYKYLENFGFGQKTGIDLQGEMSPQIRPKDKWGEIDVATTSFGQGIAVTPIQMITAVNAIANKGILVEPRVVTSVGVSDFIQELDNGQEKRVISEKASQEITAMMVEAAKSGEAKWAHLGGYGVAGKTGTAQIPLSGYYDEEKTIASFIGFAPYDNPEFTMLVTLREPQTSPWASETAAPLWYSIAKDLFLYFDIQPKS